jgi:hypothetical protein
MPRIKNVVDGLADNLADESATGGRYAGKKPPKALYKGKVRFLALRGKKVGNKFVPQKNKNGHYMIRGAVSIGEKGAKAKFNGYLINFNQNISGQGAPFVNQMLDAMFGGNTKVRREFWNKDIFLGIDVDGKITHVGKSRYTDNSIEVVVATKDVPGPNGEGQVLEVAAWLLPNAETSDEDDEAADEYDGEEGDGDETDEEITFGEDDADDADEDDSDADDEPDEPEDDADDDADGEDEGAESEDEGSDEDEEEGEDDGEEVDVEARLLELNAMTRDELKALLKEKNSDAKVMKSDTVESLAKKIVTAETGEPPF